MNCERLDRYQNAGELAVDLQQFLANESVAAHKDTLAEKAGRWSRRNPTLAATTLVGAMILAVTSSAATAVVSIAHRGERASRQEAVAAHEQELVARKEAVKPMDLTGPAFDELKMSIARSYTVIGRAFESVEESQKAIDAFETALLWADRLDADDSSTQKHHLLSTIRQDLA